MKIVICTTPIRPVPTSYPPLGSMAIIQALRSAGHDPLFYDIDAFRPKFDEVVAFFKAEAPDVVGISAVVSTAYAYTKELVLALKEALPGVKVVVGGNLAASSELLLRRCQVDVCVIGEGERVIVNLVKYFERHGGRPDHAELERIRGLAYLDARGRVVFTGYEEAIPAEELFEPDWSILEQYSKIEHFITDPLEQYFALDPRSVEAHRQGKKVGTVITAKGCVARCTFCHRWDRGYRHLPVETIVRRIKYLADRYNVGFIRFGDENFGSDRRKLEELIRALRPLDILFTVGGLRCRSMAPELLKGLKESGCVALFYGMETGSPRILEVMEKNTPLDQNINVARWTYEVGLYTIYQLVLAMPGETNETIAETADFIKQATEYLDEPPHKRLSINYIQALPGTPVYEYGRLKGLIGRSPEDEEAYLIDISDINAADDTKFVNFTQYDYLTVQSWRPRIIFEAEAHYYKVRDWRKPGRARAHATELNGADGEASENMAYEEGGYFNLRRDVFQHPLFYRFFYPLRALYIAAYVVVKDFMRMPARQVLGHLWEFVWFRLGGRGAMRDYRSLRRVVGDQAPPPASESEKAMDPLRAGR